MSEIKAIETYYKGFRFRSRLEARWAMFFDRVGVPWNYEVDPLRVDGEAYLPDFTITLYGKEGIIHEVKPESAQATIRPKWVYLAGKVSPRYEWRGEASVTGRDSRSGIDGQELESSPYTAWVDARRPVVMNGASFILVGPFPSSCDHGCAHSSGSLHMAETCDDISDVSESLIASACTGAIKAAEIICAHIETPDAYGTLVEIGAALHCETYGRRRAVSLTIDRSVFGFAPREWMYAAGHSADNYGGLGKHDLWLASAMVSSNTLGKSVLVDGHAEARSVHSAFIREHTPREYRLISAIGQNRPAVMTFGDPLNVADAPKAYHDFGRCMLTLCCRENVEAAKSVRSHRFDGT